MFPPTSKASVSTPPASTKKGRRTFSAETRAKMSAAQQARWVAKKEARQASATAEPGEKPKKRKISAAGRAAMAAAARARWANVPARNGNAKAEPKAKKKVNPALSKARSEAAKVMWAKRKAAKSKNAAADVPF